MVKLSVVIIFGVLEVRSRTIGREEQSNMETHTSRQSENRPKRSYEENKLADSTLTLLSYIISKPIKSITSNKADKLDPMDSSKEVPKEANDLQITAHRINKRSPGCLLWCLNKRILHPAQCHSYCRFQVG